MSTIIDKNDPEFAGMEEFDGCVMVDLGNTSEPGARLKKGTYKATAIAILKNSGFKGDKPTDEDYKKYGVDVSITIKVPSGTIYF